MRSVAPMRTAKIGYMIVAMALCILGIHLIIIPEFSVTVLGVICEIIFIVFGIVKLIGYFSKDLFRLVFQHDLISGILLIVLGIVMLVRPGGFISFICITLGLLILADALCKIKIAWEARSFGIRLWWLIFACAVTAGLGGVLLMLRPGENTYVLMFLLGITLLFEGILNLCTVMTSVKIIRHQRPDVIVADDDKESEA